MADFATSEWPLVIAAGAIILFGLIWGLLFCFGGKK